MKNRTILLAILVLFFFSIHIIHAQPQADTARVKPKFEYAFMTILTFDTVELFSPYKYNVIIDMDYQNGRHEQFFKVAELEVIPDLKTYYSYIFKGFSYMTAMGYQLVTSKGNLDSNIGAQYIFMRERK